MNQFIETALNGVVVSEVLEGQRTFDLLVRFDNKNREDMEALRRLSIDLPEGGTVPLESVASIYEAGGPNTINRENVRRRIVLQCNVSERGVVDVVTDIQKKLDPIAASLPPGYFVEYGGQFQSQKEASRILGVLFIVSLVGVFLTLYAMFRSVNLSLQVMAALPMAFIGSVAGAGFDRANADNRGDGRIHFSCWYCFAQRNSAAESLPASGEVRRRNVVAFHDHPSGARTTGSRADDGPDSRYRIGAPSSGGWRTGQGNSLPCRDCDTRWCH